MVVVTLRSEDEATCRATRKKAVTEDEDEDTGPWGVRSDSFTDDPVGEWRPPARVLLGAGIRGGDDGEPGITAEGAMAAGVWSVACEAPPLRLD